MAREVIRRTVRQTYGGRFSTAQLATNNEATYNFYPLDGIPAQAQNVRVKKVSCVDNIRDFATGIGVDPKDFYICLYSLLKEKTLCSAIPQNGGFRFPVTRTPADCNILIERSDYLFFIISNQSGADISAEIWFSMEIEFTV